MMPKPPAFVCVFTICNTNCFRLVRVNFLLVSLFAKQIYTIVFKHNASCIFNIKRINSAYLIPHQSLCAFTVADEIAHLVTGPSRCLLVK